MVLGLAWLCADALYTGWQAWKAIKTIKVIKANRRGKVDPEYVHYQSAFAMAKSGLVMCLAMICLHAGWISVPIYWALSGCEIISIGSWWTAAWFAGQNA